MDGKDLDVGILFKKRRSGIWHPSRMENE
jgi:hypothetical protein